MYETTLSLVLRTNFTRYTYNASALRSMTGEQYTCRYSDSFPKTKSWGDAYRRVVSPVPAELRHYDEYDCCIQRSLKR